MLVFWPNFDQKIMSKSGWNPVEFRSEYRNVDQKLTSTMNELNINNWAIFCPNFNNKSKSKSGREKILKMFKLINLGVDLFHLFIHHYLAELGHWSESDVKDRSNFGRIGIDFSINTYICVSQKTNLRFRHLMPILYRLKVDLNCKAKNNCT